MVTIRTTVLLLFICASVLLHAQTYVSGGNVSGTWDAEGSPYIIEGDIYIGSDEVLTITPGVSVLFSGAYGMEVHGRLDAGGTENEKIRFTLADTLGFADGTAGWLGLAFVGFDATIPDNSKMGHCLVEYSAGNGITCLEFPNLVITNSEFRFNKHAGILLYEASDIVVHGVEIHHNGNGGMDINYSAPQVTGFVIEYNIGPGIQLIGNSFSSQTALFKQGEIRYNITPYSGGGMTLYLDASAELKQVVISHNSAVQGGGIYTEWGYLTMQDVIIRSNEAVNGGGIFSDYGSDLQMRFTLVAENDATENGGAIYATDSYVDINRTTISNNSAGIAGGGIFYHMEFGEATGTVSSSILWNNYPEQVYSNTSGPQVRHSNIEGGYDGTGNIDGDPLFENFESGNYHLSWADYPQANATRSPCIDAGDPEEAGDEDGTIADMGAFSFFQDAVTAVLSHESPAFVLYPNPAGNTVTISGLQDMRKGFVLDPSGKVIVILEGRANQTTIDISSLRPGIYFVQIIWNNGEVSVQKLIKN